MKEVFGAKLPKYNIEIDKETGKVMRFVSELCDENLVASGDSFCFGQPFVWGTQWDEKRVLCEFVDGNEAEAHFISRSRLSKVDYYFKDNSLEISFQVPEMRGPRSGIELDFNFLDLPTGADWQKQLVPGTLYTDSDLEYAYFIMKYPQGGYVVLVVTSPFAAWRLKYSYAGHKIMGMQILAEASDVIVFGRDKLPSVSQISFQIGFCKTLKESYEFISKVLCLSMAVFNISGGPQGATIPLCLIGDAFQVVVYTPSGKEVKLGAKKNGDKMSLYLDELGMYEIQTISGSRIHRSRVLCHADWELLFDVVNDFYRKYFQRPEGSFARVIWRDTLSPEGGRTFEGVAFGDTFEEMSCRSGEFGGFAAWAMIKNLLLFGPKPKLEESVGRYIKDWAWQEGATPGRPYPGAVYTKPQEFLGRSYGPYHLYHEVNYPQHEEFFIEEFCDYYRLTKDIKSLEFAVGIAKHMLNEHTDDTGAIICQNVPHRPPVDYSSVHTPGLVFLKLGTLLQNTKFHTAGLEFLEAARRIAEHILRRGFNFPTEGEPCVEDGSMACAAITLLSAYCYLDEPDPAWLEMGRKLVELHEALVMRGLDCRMYGSSFRFWETQYETADWGPSINAGHAWTIWTCEAKVLLYLITNEIKWLRDAYSGFVANMAKVTSSGGMPCCYTPDMIPGIPHFPRNSKEPDSRMTSSLLAMDYPPKTFSASGNYFLIRAAEIWDHISGIDIYDNEIICINGKYKDGLFISCAPYFNRLALRRIMDDLRVAVPKNNDTFIVTVEEGLESLDRIEGGKITKLDGQNRAVIKIDSPVITFYTHV